MGLQPNKWGSPPDQPGIFMKNMTLGGHWGADPWHGDPRGSAEWLSYALNV